MISVSIDHVTDPAALARQWAALEAEANASFFQSWTWIGCLARERFRGAILLQGTVGGRVVAMALLGRRRSLLRGETLWLGETGDRALDAVFIEDNGVLLARGHEAALTDCLAGLMSGRFGGHRRAGSRRIVMSGVSDAVADAAKDAGATIRLVAIRPAPLVNFGALAYGPDAYLNSLRPNTRYQVRRSARKYARHGPLRLERAETVAAALSFLETLSHYNRLRWASRGKPGAFDDPRIMRFHQKLIERGIPRDEIDLLKITAGEIQVGYLYNFRYAGHVSAYQSGFNYGVVDAHMKPGLTSHHLAIEHYRTANLNTYDFLAGSDRYKTSLSNATRNLHWIEIAPANSLAGLRIGSGIYLRSLKHRLGQLARRASKESQSAVSHSLAEKDESNME